MDSFWITFHLPLSRDTELSRGEACGSPCDRSDIPSSHPLNHLARLREEVESDDGSSADARVVDGLERDSLCRLALVTRSETTALMVGGGAPLPAGQHWKTVVTLFRKFSQQFCAENLLMDLALGRVEAMPFPTQEVAKLEDQIIASLSDRGLSLQRFAGDRDELPIDISFLDLSLRASDDLELHLESFAQGVKVGLGTRMAKLPVLDKPLPRGRATVRETVEAELRKSSRSGGSHFWKTQQREDRS